MILEILAGTPKWLLALHIFLLVRGFIQRKPMRVKIKGLFLTPIFWTCISCYSIYNIHGSNLIGFAMWGLGILAAITIGQITAFPRGSFYTREDETFFIPGSWTPLLLTMIIFITKNIVVANLAINREDPLHLTNSVSFFLITSFLYGYFSGIFTSRSIVIWRTKKRPFTNRKAVT